jgi:hypothetical protein
LTLAGWSGAGRPCCNSLVQNASEQSLAIVTNTSTAPQASATNRTVNYAKRWGADCTSTITSDFSENPSVKQHSPPFVTSERQRPGCPRGIEFDCERLFVL